MSGQSRIPPTEIRRPDRAQLVALTRLVLIPRASAIKGRSTTARVAKPRRVRSKSSTSATTQTTAPMTAAN